MLKEYINKPYIIFPFGSPKLALVITIAYLIVFACFFLYDRKTKHLKIKIRWIHTMPKREKNKTIISLIGFVCLVAFSIILPFFFAEDNLILTISKIYLEYEALPFLAVILFLCSAVFNKVNKDKQIVAANKILNILIWISISTGLLTGQMNYKIWENMTVLICAFILNYLILTIDIKSVTKIQDDPYSFDLISYAPVKDYESLFPVHQDQADDIIYIISNLSFEPFSLCVSGEWGSGKTSFVNAVLDSYTALHLHIPKRSLRIQYPDFVLRSCETISHTSAMILRY